MRVMVLAVPDCPNAMLLEERLAQVLDGRRAVSVSRQVIEGEREAARGLARLLPAGPATVRLPPATAARRPPR
jgi:hypothetical protein